MTIGRGQGWAAIGVVAWLVGGCGGDSGSAEFVPIGPPVCVPPPEGPLPTFAPTVAGGSLSGHSSPSFLLVARAKDDERVLFYGPNLPAEPRVTGYVYIPRNTQCSRHGAPTYNGEDKRVDSSFGASVYLHLVAPPSGTGVSGSIRYPNATYAIAGGSISGASYNAAAKPAVADAVGDWSMTDFSGQSWKLSVDPSGRFTASEGACDLTGTLEPDARDGLNLLQVKLTRPLCKQLTVDGTFDGFVLVIPMHSGGSRLLFWTVTDAWGGLVDFGGIGQR